MARIESPTDVQPIHSNHSFGVTDPEKRSYGLADTFATDTHQTIKTDFDHKSTHLDTKTNELNSTQSSDKVFKPISSEPILEEPTVKIPDEIASKLVSNFPKRLREKDRTDIREIDEILVQLNSRTIEDMILLILAQGMDIEKENVLICNQTFEKYAAFKNNKDEVINKIKEEIMKDKNLMSLLETPAKVAAAASVICGLAAAASTFGVAAPIGAALGATLGAFFVASISSLASAAPVTAAACAGFKGIDIFLEKRFNDKKARDALISHEDKYLDTLIEDNFKQMETAAGRENFYRKFVSEFNKNKSNLVSFVLQKE